MKVTFLGTNGWYDSSTGSTVSIAVETPSVLVVLDAGFGIAKLDEDMAREKPLYLFLSHLHLDHIVGLHALCAYHAPKGIVICAPAGSEAILRTFLDAPFTMPLSDYRSPTSFIELPRGEREIPFSVRSMPLVHTVPALGYRFEVEGKVLTYVGDTGYCESAIVLARGADLLITECAYSPGYEDKGWPHLNPESAARIAREAEAKRLALVHFDARMYPDVESRREAEASAREVFPNTVAASDGLVMEV